MDVAGITGGGMTTSRLGTNFLNLARLRERGLLTTHNTMKEELKKLIEQFLKDTDAKRTEIDDECPWDTGSIREPSFQDFIDWINL